MEAAFELFGRYGIEGTSVREIAKKSKVNLSAINYHFKNKEGLFWEIMAHTYKEVDQDIHRLVQESKDTIELSGKIFDYFSSEGLALKNTMKMMLSEGIGCPTTPEIVEIIHNPMGPPGGVYLAAMIQKDISYKLTREGSLWAVKSIFGAITHWAMLVSSEKIKSSSSEKPDPLMSPKQIRKDVLMMTESSLDYLRKNKKKFIR